MVHEEHLYDLWLVGHDSIDENCLRLAAPLRQHRPGWFATRHSLPLAHLYNLSLTHFVKHTSNLRRRLLQLFLRGRPVGLALRSVRVLNEPHPAGQWCLLVAGIFNSWVESLRVSE